MIQHITKQHNTKLSNATQTHTTHKYSQRWTQRAADTAASSHSSCTMPTPTRNTAQRSVTPTSPPMVTSSPSIPAEPPTWFISRCSSSSLGRRYYERGKQRPGAGGTVGGGKKGRKRLE